MNQRRFKTNTDYYVWHGEGECDNKTDDLREALHIRTDLIADGHKPVYIIDSHNDEIDDDYIARLFINVRQLSAQVSHQQDESAAGLYQVRFSGAVQQNQELRREELAEIALRVFDAHQGIDDLPDFEIEVVDAFGCVIDPDTEYEALGVMTGMPRRSASRSPNCASRRNRRAWSPRSATSALQTKASRVRWRRWRRASMGWEWRSRSTRSTAIPSTG